MIDLIREIADRGWKLSFEATDIHGYSVQAVNPRKGHGAKVYYVMEPGEVDEESCWHFALKEILDQIERREVRREHFGKF